MTQSYDYLIVGAGFAGSVLAERLSSELGRTCLVVDRRGYVGGNAADFIDRAGVLLHRHGPHYFRTNSERVRDYLSRFTEWHPIEYRILSWTHGRFWSFPINLNTYEQLIGHASTPEDMVRALAEWRMPIHQPRNSEEFILSKVGPTLYEMFYRNYTAKQWRRPANELDASVCGRIAIRTNRDDRFFTERFQALPKHGYSRMFERILAHPKITLRLNTDYRDVLSAVGYKHMIYTGPVDEYFDACYGRLAYRSLRFEAETLEQEFFQPAVQVNYPNDHDFTRIVELKHATGQQLPVTTIVREYPEDFAPGREAYYPMPTTESAARYARYRERADAEPNVSFVGRLATYRYYNMDQVVGMALAEFDKLRARPLGGTS